MRRRFFINRIITFAVIICMFILTASDVKDVSAHPHYPLNAQKIVLRGEFFTEYNNSSAERKHNIYLATKSLNNTIIFPYEVFSFNDVIGERTSSRGYKNAKIIVGGQFVDGIGGGVCQVSTTLYNACLTSGLNVIEYHPHTLQVNYVKPSFDAMVNSGYADLKIENQTANPVIIKASANGSKLTVKIYGEPLIYKVSLKSEIVATVKPQPPIIQYTNDQTLTEEKYVVYPKDGVKSVGKIIMRDKQGKVYEKLFRKDYYKEIRGILLKNAETTKQSEQPKKN